MSDKKNNENDSNVFGKSLSQNALNELLGMCESKEEFFSRTAEYENSKHNIIDISDIPDKDEIIEISERTTWMICPYCHKKIDPWDAIHDKNKCPKCSNKLKLEIYIT